MKTNVKSLIKCFIVLILWNNISNAQSIYKNWDKVYGGNGSDRIQGVLKMPDGGYLLYGYSDSGISGNKTETNRGLDDYWFAEMNLNDSIIWDKTFGGFSTDDLHSITITQNSLLLAGISYSGQEADKSEFNRGLPINTSDFWFIKTNLTGTKIFDKTFGTPENDGLVKIIPTKTAYFLIGTGCSCGGGDMSAPGNGQGDVWIIKTDTFGNKIWDKTYGGSMTELVSDAISLSNGNILIASSSGSGISGTKTTPNFASDTLTTDYWFFSIDTNGNQLWDKSYGGDSMDIASGILLSSTNYIYFLGTTNSGVSGNKTEQKKGDWDRWILKADLTGNIIWQKDFGALKFESLFGFTFSPDESSILISGTSNSHLGFDKTEENFTDQSQSWLLSIDTNGTKLWDKTVRSNDIDIPGAPIYIDDHCFYYITSSASSIGGDKTQMPIDNGLYDFWVLKYCDYPNSINDKIQNESINVSIYPNPANEELIVEILDGVEIHQIEITNELGETVIQLKQTKPNQKINIKSLAAGVYFVKVQMQNGDIQVKKFVKE